MPVADAVLLNFTDAATGPFSLSSPETVSFYLNTYHQQYTFQQ